MGDRIVKGQGRTQVRLEALDTGNGICLCLTGGEAPHVGGVVLAADVYKRQCFVGGL